MERWTPHWRDLDERGNNPRRKAIAKHRCKVWRLAIAPIEVIDGPEWGDRAGYCTDIYGPSQVRPSYKIDRFQAQFATLKEAREFVIEKAIANRQHTIRVLADAIGELRRDIANLQLLGGTGL